MADKTPLRSEEAELIQLVVFNLGDEKFGVDIGAVREIIRTGTVTPMPDSPEFIKGVINVRGEIAATIDLKARFSLPTKEDGESKHILITEQGDNLFGLMVSEVTDVLRIPSTAIKAAPELAAKVHEEYVSGVVTLENRLIVLLDLAKVLSEEELSRLAEVQRGRRSNGEPKPQRAEEKTSEDTPTVVAEGAKKRGRQGKKSGSRRAQGKV